MSKSQFVDVKLGKRWIAGLIESVSCVQTTRGLRTFASVLCADEKVRVIRDPARMRLTSPQPTCLFFGIKNAHGVDKREWAKWDDVERTVFNIIRSERLRRESKEAK